MWTVSICVWPAWLMTFDPYDEAFVNKFHVSCLDFLMIQIFNGPAGYRWQNDDQRGSTLINPTIIKRIKVSVFWLCFCVGFVWIGGVWGNLKCTLRKYKSSSALKPLTYTKTIFSVWTAVLLLHVEKEIKPTTPLCWCRDVECLRKTNWDWQDSLCRTNFGSERIISHINKRLWAALITGSDVCCVTWLMLIQAPVILGLNSQP